MSSLPFERICWRRVMMKAVIPALLAVLAWGIFILLVWGILRVLF